LTEPDSPIAPPRAKQAAAVPALSAVPVLSVVVPVHNEAGNIEPLISEIDAALAGRIDFEIVYVDDGSGDGSGAELAGLRTGNARLRVLRHDKRAGQSAALWTGVAAARAAWIATLDGDGQNDPADIPALLEARDSRATPKLWMVAGVRRKRRDSTLKRLSSRIANGHPAPGAARRDHRYRLRPQAVPARRLLDPAVLRPHAPFPAGPDPARWRRGH
jgi:glycosyltransferase involved in cell wall biosynthesis